MTDERQQKKLDALAAVIPTGRAQAKTIGELRIALHQTAGIWVGDSTVRAWLHRLQAAGVEVLTSTRAGGVWLAADDQEVLDVVQELREQIQALERRAQLINRGRCALASCRAELPVKVVRRGGLFCCPAHRFQAAEERTKRGRDEAVDQQPAHA